MCLQHAPCKICEGCPQMQKAMLSTLKYQILKDKKARVLIDAKDVTVVGPVEGMDNSVYCASICAYWQSAWFF